MGGKAGSGAERAVRSRRVFYVPGYDPFPPRRYRELYRREAEAQAAIAGYEISVARSPGDARHGWHGEMRHNGGASRAEIEVLVWSDIVQGSMAQGIAATYGQLLRTAWAYIGSGALFRLMRLRKGPMLAALYPIVALILQALGGLALGLWAARAAAHGAGTLAGIAAGILIFVATLRAFRALDHRLYAYYLMHDYAFTAQAGGAYPPELEARLAMFRDRIGAAMGGDWDEVLVVGHSSGAHLAVSILADLIRQGGVGRRGPALGLLTLGQVVPMVAFLPRADRLRADLAYLSERDELTWVDVTAPGDGCAFALCDPVAVSGMAGAGKRWPLVLSAAFSQTLDQARWKRLRWRFFRLHFQYLCAFDRPEGYDYFAITAGLLTLADRYADTLPSPSRIERALNGHGGRR